MYFQLTPAYDVISAYPLVAKGQHDRKRMAMAMSLRGKNRHYLWEEMFHRHWLSTAKWCNFPEDEMTQIIKRIMADMDGVIDQVGTHLPEGFPDDVATPIFDGMLRARDRISG